MLGRRNRENEFDARTKRQLADRAGHECSICRAHTTGPSDDHARAVNNVGVAAHICGAKLGSSRYDRNMSAAQRSAIENGIWLCQKCAKQVDGDARTWTIAELFCRKFAAEQRAKDRLGRRRRRRKDVKFALGQCFYAERFQAMFLPVRIVNEDSRGVTVESVELVVGGVEYEASDPIPSVTVGDRVLLNRPPTRLAGRDAVQGAWVFRGMTECPFSECKRPAIELVTKVVDRAEKRHVIAREGVAPTSAASPAPTADVVDDGSIR